LRCVLLLIVGFPMDSRFMARYTKESFPRPTFVTAVQLCHTAVPGGIVGLSGNLPTRTSHTLAASCPRKRYTSRAPDHGHGRRTPDSTQIATDGFEQRNYRALAHFGIEERVGLSKRRSYHNSARRLSILYQCLLHEAKYAFVPIPDQKMPARFSLVVDARAKPSQLCHHANNSSIRLPPLTIGTGRPSGVS
jgi:hypothetical protein